MEKGLGVPVEPESTGSPSLEERGCQRAWEAVSIEVDARERTWAGEFGGRGRRGSVGGGDTS